MSNSEQSALTEFLFSHDQQAWLTALETLSSSIVKSFSLDEPTVTVPLVKGVALDHRLAFAGLR